MVWPDVTQRVRLYENPWEDNEDKMGEHPDLPPEGSPMVRHPEEPAVNPFDDDEPIVASCDLENPESCESCT